MYEFDADRWEQAASQSHEPKGIDEGWLIERTNTEPETRIRAEPLYLQIGTGQWCGARYATLFPLRNAAVVYAKEFGYVVGENVRIVRHRF